MASNQADALSSFLACKYANTYVVEYAIIYAGWKSEIKFFYEKN